MNIRKVSGRRVEEQQWSRFNIYTYYSLFLWNFYDNPDSHLPIIEYSSENCEETEHFLFKKITSTLLYIMTYLDTRQKEITRPKTARHCCKNVMFMACFGPSKIHWVLWLTYLATWMAYKKVHRLFEADCMQVVIK